MNCLIVIAHHNLSSYNHAILGAIKDELIQAGHQVRVRDLYQLDFQANLIPTPGSVQQDVVTEQEHIRWADTMIFIYPTWWANMPAILKGYIDRVFTYGFAYQFSNNELVGLFAEKQVLLFTTTNNLEEDYRNSGMLASMSQVVDEGVFRFCGVTNLTHTYLSHIHGITEAERRALLDEVKELIRVQLPVNA